MTRAPRILDADARPARLLPVPYALQGAIVALITRDTRQLALDDAQRLTHFPASPLFSLSWFGDAEVGLVDSGDDSDGVRPCRRPCWRPFGADAVVSGSHAHPTVSWAPTGGRGGILCFTADTARKLFGIEPAVVHDRFVPARALLGADWFALLDALVAADNDAATLAALQRHLAPRWQRLQWRAGSLPALSQIGRHWVERLALAARDWRGSCSSRQVERRIKEWSGRSMREWQGLVKTESLFFAARARHDAGLPFDWAALAQDHGFADQAHLVRSARRITGFAPGEFAERFLQDESFWLYRLWV